MVFICLSAALLGLAAALLLPPRYIAVASFVPERASASRLPSGLGSLASQFGVSLGSDGLQSSRFYADVLLSRRVVEGVLRGYYSAVERGVVGLDSASLLDILRIQGRDSLDRLQKGVKKLRGAMSVAPDVRTNIVTLTVAAPDPYLAAAVANRFVATVNEFNTRNRQSQAGRRRRFIEQQADSAERELRAGEDRLKSFYEQNRSWAQSPELQYRLGQLQRQVDIEKEVYLTLRRELETARIDEVNDLPLVSVIDVAVPWRERKPKRAPIVIAGLIAGVALSLLYAYAAWYWEGLHERERAADAP
jgi:uncharacterized protein involved in exopolysaccharide biosynthesis